VPSILPDGEPVPADGRLPEQAFEGMADRALSLYVHVPFCATRCGYCDFNTYTAAELGSASSTQAWLAAALAEIDLAAGILGDHRQVSTVFVGGGTPSMVGAGPLVEVLDRINQRFGLTSDAEVTSEANPESASREFLDDLHKGGFTRLSLGLQSTSTHVLAVLERRHTPGLALEVVANARAAGFEHVNLDLIYGTPGETDSDFAGSLDAVIGSGVDHVSAYSLIVEPGTRLARQVASGLLPTPDEDVLADRYLQADAALTAAGFHWYEVSNWARSVDARCRHNLAYWTGADWWGIGPGAHSHVGGVRWWNVKHPARYAAALAERRSPGHAREVLTSTDRQTEKVLLGLRIQDGLTLADLSGNGPRLAEQAAADGLLSRPAIDAGRLELTLQGRLLADGLALSLLS
jgi:putative oxygen-independent coproporphyrinogen III oxidase